MWKAEQRGTCGEIVSPSPRMTRISRFARNDDAGESDVSQSLVPSPQSLVLRHLFHLMLGIEENDAVSAAFFGEVEGIVHALVEARLGLLR